MQSISPLTAADFTNKSNIVIGKVEIDSDGLGSTGSYLELPEITGFNFRGSEENEVSRFCAYSFSITCLNTGDRYTNWNVSSPQYDWLKQGRRIKVYAGIKVSGTDRYYKWLTGRVDYYTLSELAGREICTITGRDFMRATLDYKLFYPNTYWGSTVTHNTVSGQIRYGTDASCKGIYRVELDSTSPYNGSKLEEIFEGSDWAYDWNTNEFCFAPRQIPDFVGTNNLKIYYLQTQDVEDIVGDVLYKAGMFATTGERDTWIANADYVTPTGETIDRVWFNNGTSALEAIRLLSEVVQYRFYFDYAGNPVFKPKGTGLTADDDMPDEVLTKKDIQEVNDEVYNDIIVLGEIRDRILGDDEVAPAVPSNLALTTGFGEETQAGLAYIKATWDANTEIDFGHYELRIKKNADSDYLEVSTIATSYMFYGLEPGVTYNVQIRAVDIYENRSAWSSAENQVTATDASTPAKIAGETATAIVMGVKIEWTKGSEDNIAYYLVESQESPDNVDWSAGWVEVDRIDGDLCLDLLLTYSKWYRYRITAYTQASVTGVTSDFTTAVQPSQVGTNDVAADAITAVKIDVIDLAAIKADMGHITAGDLTLDSDGYIKTVGKDSYADTTAGFWLGYDAGAYKLNIGNGTDYLKFDGANLTIKGVTTTDTLSAINADLGTITAGTIQLSNTGYIRTVNKTSYADTTAGFWLGYETGYKLNLGSATNWLKWTGTALEIKGRLSVGLDTDEDIYFEDSEISLYDHLSETYKGIALKYSTDIFCYLDFDPIIKYANLGVGTPDIYTTIDSGGRLKHKATPSDIVYLYLTADSGIRSFYFRSSGTLQLCALETAPTAHVADLTYHIDEGNDPYFHGYIGPPDNSWGKIALTAPNW